MVALPNCDGLDALTLGVAEERQGGNRLVRMDRLGPPRPLPVRSPTAPGNGNPRQGNQREPEGAERMGAKHFVESERLAVSVKPLVPPADDADQFEAA